MQKYINTIYNYYPKDLAPTDPRYPFTIEMQNFFKLQEIAGRDNKIFEKLLATITDELKVPTMDYSLRGVFNLSYSGTFHIPESFEIINFKKCVFIISLISKYYCIYLTQIHESENNTLANGPTARNEKKLIDYIAQIVQSSFPEYQTFPMKYFKEKVSGIYSAKRPFEYATFFECLITDQIL
jgi:hypothetical protein